jgi:uncharacterized protein YaiI (UPF0178 family)
MLKKIQSEDSNNLVSDEMVKSAQEFETSNVQAEKIDLEREKVQTHRQSDSHKEIISNVMKLAEQWLPVHCVPDDVMVVNDIPFTKHGNVSPACLQCIRN